MKKTRFLKHSALLLSVAFAVSGLRVYGQTGYLVEAEDFQFKGKWYVQGSGDCSGGKMLRVDGGGSDSHLMDAVTMVEIPVTGRYDVWVRAWDQEPGWGTRTFTISVNETEQSVSGVHGNTGFYWEKVGTVSIEQPEVLLRIHDSRRYYGRCDAIFFTTEDGFDPNAIPIADFARWRIEPVEIETTQAGFDDITGPLPFPENPEVLAQVDNGEIRVGFVFAGPDGNSLACRTEVNLNGNWTSFFGMQEDHKVFLITSDANTLNNDEFYPGWSQTTGYSEFEFMGQTITVISPSDFLNPYRAGNLSEAIPVGAEKLDEHTIQVKYVTRNGSVITGYWTVPQAGTHVNVRLSCTAAETGLYSMGIAAFQAVAGAYGNDILLPPLFQLKRLPENPNMVLSSMMQQPLAIAESNKATGQRMSAFISADLTTTDLGWGTVDYSPIGFGIKNYDNAVQPVAFSPVIGMEDSRVEQGRSVARSFVLGLAPVTLGEMMEYVSDNVFRVYDYRKQEDVSLTKAMFNILDLMRNEEYGGWDPAMKGFYDIELNPEVSPTVVHAAPLAIVAAAVTQKDEDFYLKYALPTIEFTLSRSGYRWARDVTSSGFNNTLESLLLNPFTSQFTTSHYEGLNRMLDGLNPWLGDIALPDGAIRTSNGYSVRTISWVEQLSAYRMTGQDSWLQTARTTADRWLNTSLYASTTTPQGSMAFFNSITNVPWWDLIDLYEITGDMKYLDGARFGAAQSISGIRSYPAVIDPDKLQTIHPGDVYDGNTTLWWKGDEQFRLGFPRVPGDAPQHEVPEWLVSPVGLTFEQSGTYFLRAEGKLVRPVFMNNISPHFLRLYQHTGKSIYEIYARNAIIGRFKNYPGYYATGYTDITIKEDFPYVGPDVSSIYYHHLPPHLAFVWDYLVTEAIQRSGGNVDFPAAKQEGFVWFHNRIYGRERGRIFGDEDVRLWMRKDLVEVSNPDVNFVTALSGNNFWILLCNESDSDKTADITLNNVPGISGNTATLHTVSGETTPRAIGEDRLDALVPAKGFSAVSIPVTGGAEPGYAPLQNGMVTIETGDPLRRIHLFRIRSPFGWDSVYGCAETYPLKDNDVTIEVTRDGESVTVNKYPFEWSFTHIGMDEEVTLLIKTTIDGNVTTREVALTAR